MKLSVLFLVILAMGCGGAPERNAREMWSTSSPPPALGTKAPSFKFEAGLPGYVEYALAHQPGLGSAHARWSAAIHRVSRSERLPDPMLMVGIRAVNEKMGAGVGTVGIQQALPWPTRLGLGADAAAEATLAEKNRYDATSLAIVERVSRGYWGLWKVRQLRTLHEEHLQIVQSLAEAVRSRLATGGASLADQQQVDLTVSRIADDIETMKASEAAWEAELRMAIGAPDLKDLPTQDDAPLPSSLGEDRASLATAAAAHPALQVYGSLAKSKETMARAEAADGLPDFLVSAEWSLAEDSLMVGAGISLPLWRGSYGDAVDAMEAEALMYNFEGQMALEAALAALDSELALLNDAVRRSAVLNDVLIPQANAAYESVVGGYVTGNGNITQLLMAQRDLLDLRIALESVRFDYVVSKARLEQIVGREIPRGEK